MQKSTCLEHAMSFSSMVLDVFEPVSDQTERRSRGTDSLTLSKDVWERFSRQLRICLLLSMTSINGPSNQTAGGVSSVNGMTVSKLNSGEISIFKLLAEDTLCFAELPEHVSFNLVGVLYDV